MPASPRAAANRGRDAGGASPPRTPRRSSGIEKRLTSHLGARVALLHSPKKGRIVIEYRGNEDLQRLLEVLGVKE